MVAVHFTQENFATSRLRLHQNLSPAQLFQTVAVNKSFIFIFWLDVKAAECHLFLKYEPFKYPMNDCELCVSHLKLKIEDLPRIHPPSLFSHWVFRYSCSWEILSPFYQVQYSVVIVGLFKEICSKILYFLSLVFIGGPSYFSWDR